LRRGASGDTRWLSGESGSGADGSSGEEEEGAGDHTVSIGECEGAMKSSLCSDLVLGWGRQGMK